MSLALRRQFNALASVEGMQRRRRCARAMSESRRSEVVAVAEARPLSRELVASDCVWRRTSSTTPGRTSETLVIRSQETCNCNGAATNGPRQSSVAESFTKANTSEPSRPRTRSECGSGRRPGGGASPPIANLGIRGVIGAGFGAHTARMTTELETASLVETILTEGPSPVRGRHAATKRQSDDRYPLCGI